tara:strand:+ start:203 stop:496 length:294 start_codon:yes stop_codon:yes gene_type:complete
MIRLEMFMRSEKMGNNQLTFDGLDDRSSWEKEWQDMPEFVMEDTTSFRTLKIHFRNFDDVDRFAKLIGQHISPKVKSLWFPEMLKRRYANKRYVDES